MERICVIGGGRWGENHIRTLHEMGNLGAVVDMNAARLEELKDKYGMAVYTDLDKAITHGYEGYVVSTSAETHYAIGKKLLSLGLPTLIEKPMTMQIEESRELVEIAERTGANFMVAHILHFHPAINKIKELIDSGAVGEVYYMYSTRIKFGVVRTEENVFESFAPHDLATLNYFAGVPAEKMILHRGYFLQKDICDYVLAYLEYPNNVKAHIQVSWLHPFKEQRVVVVAHGGTIMAALHAFADGSSLEDDYFGWSVGCCEGYECDVTWPTGHLRLTPAVSTFASRQRFRSMRQ